MGFLNRMLLFNNAEEINEDVTGRRKAVNEKVTQQLIRTFQLAERVKQDYAAGQMLQRFSRALDGRYYLLSSSGWDSLLSSEP